MVLCAGSLVVRVINEMKKLEPGVKKQVACNENESTSHQLAVKQAMYRSCSIFL